MHSSRMRTAHPLPYGASLSRGALSRGVSVQGGVCLGDTPGRNMGQETETLQKEHGTRQSDRKPDRDPFHVDRMTETSL